MAAASASASATSAAELPGIETGLVYSRPGPKRLRAYKDPAGKTDAVNSPCVVMKRVHDARALETPPTLSTMGFELIHAPTTLSYDEFLDDDKVRAVYYAEAALAIEAITGARRVVAIHHLVRSSKPGSKDTPAGSCHSDYSPLNAMKLYESQAGVGEEKGRFAVINLWKPIVGPVVNHHLAMCDGRTVTAPDDMLVLDLVDGTHVSEMFQLSSAGSNRHKWYYFPRMQPSELLMFMQYDSDPTAPSRFCFHSSITDPTCPADAPPRQSIEIRCLAFFPDHPENTIPPPQYRTEAGGVAGCANKIINAFSFPAYWPAHAKQWVRATAHTEAGLRTVIHVMVTEGGKKGEHGLHLITAAQRDEVKALLLTERREALTTLLNANFPPLTAQERLLMRAAA